MNWLDKLERRFGRYAIHNLMYYIIILYGVGFVMQLISPMFYYSYLSLNVEAVLHGQIWRIVTFIIQPPSSSPIFMLIALYFYYMLGSSLERTWGAFRFNVYFFGGVLFHVIAAFVVYVLTGLSLPLGTGYLNLSLFFCLCSFVSEYGIFGVFYDSCESEMAGAFRRSVFCLCNPAGISSGVRGKQFRYLL